MDLGREIKRHENVPATQPQVTPTPAVRTPKEEPVPV